MATPLSSAADADAKTTMTPSPRFLTSVPPVSAIAWRSTEKGPRWTSSATSAVSRWDNSVDPTKSVNRIATFSVVIVIAPLPAPPKNTWRRLHPLGVNAEGPTATVGRV